MLSKQDLTNLKNLIGDVVDEKLNQRLGENFKEKIERIENNTDSACKVAKDAEDELAITRSKVDDHDLRLTSLESNFATT